MTEDPLRGDGEPRLTSRAIIDPFQLTGSGRWIAAVRMVGFEEIPEMIVVVRVVMIGIVVVRVVVARAVAI